MKLPNVNYGIYMLGAMLFGLIGGQGITWAMHGHPAAWLMAALWPIGFVVLSVLRVKTIKREHEARMSGFVQR